MYENSANYAELRLNLSKMPVATFNFQVHYLYNNLDIGWADAIF